MDKENKYKEVFLTIESALDLEANTIDLKSTSKSIDNWDSLGHLSILMALDSKYDGKVVEISEMATAMSVEKIIKNLEDNSLI